MCTAPRFHPLLLIALLALPTVWLGCGEDAPTTWYVRKGNVVMGAWGARDADRTKALLKAWVAAPVPPDTTYDAPPFDFDAMTAAFPENGVIKGWDRGGESDLGESAQLVDFLRVAPDQYVAFGDRGYVSQEFVNPRLTKEPLLRVDIHDMTTPDNAFGFYSQKRVVGGRIRALGAQSFVGARDLHGWSDRFYFYISVYEYSTDTVEAIEAFAYEVGKRLGGVTEAPLLTTALPMDDIVPFSPKWFRTTKQAQTATKQPDLFALQVDSSERGFVALLKLDEVVASDVFYIVYPSESAASEAFAALREVSIPHNAKSAELGVESARFVQPPPSPY
ncbi:MAG: hypothetical protein O3A46_12720 [Candidatus Poribacteria bacterium]|nr:hypothetical protein [Candidatus Poribacteria bacterium]